MYIEQQLPERRLPKTLTLRPKFIKPSLPIPFFLAFKEIWRYRGRYLLISLVIALITTLVLFIAGLAEGLGAGNKEYLDKLNADAILYQANIDLSIPSSRIDRTRVNNVQRVEGVKEVGTISFGNAAIPLNDGSTPLKVSLIGVEPGKPGEPPALEGQNLKGKRDNEAIIDKNPAGFFSDRAVFVRLFCG